MSVKQTAFSDTILDTRKVVAEKWTKKQDPGINQGLASCRLQNIETAKL